MSRALGKKSAQFDHEKLSTILAFGGAVFSLGTYLKNTLLLNSYKRFIELMGNDGRVEPSLKLMNLVTEVTEDLKERACEYTDIQPVIVPGLNTIHLGAWGTFQGGFVGIPVFFEYNTKEDILGKIEVKSKGKENDITGESEDTYKLFLLSNDAKKYAIAREVLLINNLQVYVDTILPVGTSFLVTQVLKLDVVSHGLAGLPASSRAFFYAAITLLGVVLWRKGHGILKRHNEKQAEKEISTLGENYIKGALEYNSKASQHSSYIVAIRDQDNRILNIVREKIQILVPRSLSASQKYVYFKNLLDSNTGSNKLDAA